MFKAVARFYLVFSTFVTFSSAFGTECTELPSALKLRQVSFEVVEPTDRYVVQVVLPDLKKAQCEEINFEYGTDYYFKLNGSNSIRINYYKIGESRPSRSVEMKRHLNVHSVMLASARSKTPHYLEIKDSELNVTYEIYLSVSRGPSFAKREGEDRSFKIISHR